MSYIRELKRRNVFRVAIAYLAASWLLIQITETIFPVYGLSQEAIRLLVTILAVGFPVALVVSWVFEITPEGWKLEKDIDRSRSTTHRTGKRLDKIIIAVLAIGLGYFALDKFVLEPPRDASSLEAATDKARAEALVEAYTENSIAVLPFDDISINQDQEYLSNGITEEMTRLLSSIPNLKVISRSSSFIFKGKEISISNISEQLSVDNILKGSIAKIDDRLNISVQLVDGRSDSILWSEVYDRNMSDIFNIQDEVASAVVESLRITMLGESPKSQQIDPEEYRKYLYGEFLLDQADNASLQQAREILESVTKEEPDYAPAWVRLGKVYLMQSDWGFVDHDAGYQQAHLAANVASRIDPKFADAHLLIGDIQRRYNWDWNSAEDSFLTASELNPNSARALVAAAKMALTLGDVENAVDLNMRAVDLNPLGNSTLQNLGIKQLWALQLKDAEKTFERLSTRNPQYPTAHLFLAVTYLLQNMPDEALVEAELESHPPLQLQALSLAHWAKGNRADAEHYLSELMAEYGDVWMFQIAETLAFMGNVDEAFAWLQKAIDAKDSGMSVMKADPLLVNLRGDIRWDEFLDQMGLPR